MSALHTSLPSGVPLVVKANCDERIKRIRFPPDLSNLQFGDFQEKVAKALQFDDVDFCITWEDDDGEHCEIASTDDLQEALFYFCPSGSSDCPTEPLTMRVAVRVDTKISLSDYGSSVWAGSDDEGTVASGNSRGPSRSRRSSSKSRASTNAGSSSYSLSSRSYASGSLANGGYQARSNASSRHGPSPLFRSWHASVDPQADPNTPSSESHSNYGDAMTNFTALSLGTSNRLTDDPSGSEPESEGSAHTRGPGARRRSTKRSLVALTDDTSIHRGVQCRSCQMMPIIGARYHCASCLQGADFCADCERTGYAVRAQVGHEASHLILRLAAPLDSSQAVDALNAVLGLTQRRLLEGWSSTSQTFNRASASSTVTRTISHSSSMIKCSFCVTPILQGPRFLCANCPIVSQTSLEGFNLCSACQEHSLQCHDPSHFFIKINPLPRALDTRTRIPLGERWEVQEITKGGALLPTLYADVQQQNSFQVPGSDARNGQNMAVRMGDGMVVMEDEDRSVRIGQGQLSLNVRSGGAEARRRAQEIEMRTLRESQSRYLVPLDRLVHPSILCDNCFSVIHGIWYRCCHCTTSFDLCDMCESKIAHSHSHSFAVFKQPVDLDLFKSCVDHQDAGEGLIGASRPMLAFPLL